MTDLPETYQGMIQYVAYAEAELKRCELKIKRLNTDIQELKPKINAIQEQLNTQKQGGKDV